jgi:hypothetical protein
MVLQVPGRPGYGPGTPMAPQMGGGPRMPPHPGMHPPQMHHSYPPPPPQGKLQYLFDAKTVYFGQTEIFIFVTRELLVERNI